MRNLLIFGGTFDPIHDGHLNVAINVQKHFNFARFIFLPCKVPVLKNKALASEAERLDMIELALKEHPNQHFEIDAREIKRDGPSYMVTTLRDYRRELGDAIPITLLMGEDTFEKLPYWHEWEQLLSLANILLIKRPGSAIKLPTVLNDLLRQHETNDEKLILTHKNGFIFRFNAGLYDLSSTVIREQLLEKLYTIQIPGEVIKYIQEKKLYLG